jgi:hypothetical protein
MALSMFDDKTTKPTPKRLAAALGKRYRLWNEVKAHTFAKCPAATEEWKFAGAKYGWSFRLKDKKRNILYMTPSEGFIRVAFVFGDKAADAVEKSSLPEAIKNELRNATRYVEGRGLRLLVREQRDVAAVKQLLDIKTAS